MKRLLMLCVPVLMVLGAIAAGCSSESGNVDSLTFTFNPPDSISYNGITISERSVSRGTMSIVDSSYMVSSHTFVHEGDHWRLTSVSDTLNTVRDGELQNDAVTALYPGVKFTQVIDSTGTSIEMTGFEEILRKADSALPAATAENLRKNFKPDFLARREMNEWNAKIARFAGKTMKIGEMIYDTNSVPVPGAGSITYYRAIKLVAAPKIDGKQYATFNLSAYTEPSKLAEHLQIPVEEVYKQLGMEVAPENTSAQQVTSSLVSEWTIETATMLLHNETTERQVNIAVGNMEMSTKERRSKEYTF